MLLVISQNFSCRIFPTPFKMNNLADVCLVVIAIFKLRTNFLRVLKMIIYSFIKTKPKRIRCVGPYACTNMIVRRVQEAHRNWCTTHIQHAYSFLSRLYIQYSRLSHYKMLHANERLYSATSSITELQSWLKQFADSIVTCIA